MRKLSRVLLSGLLLTTAAAAQVAETDPLYARALALDSRLFKDTFNDCKPGVLETLIDTRLEFYHDVAGMQDREAFLAAVAKNICGPVDRKPIRRLIAGTSKVFPLNKDGKLYGLIHHGDHEFWIRERGKPEYKTGRAKFTSVWIESKGAWRLRTVLSYDHGPAS
jgi:hypothetical protein